MWREEVHAFLVPVERAVRQEAGLARRGVVELPPFPKAAQGTRALPSPPLLVGRQTPCVQWALGNSLRCSRTLFEVTSWVDTHATPYPVPSLAPLHNVGVRLRCLDSRRSVQVHTPRSPPPLAAASHTASSAPLGAKQTPYRTLEQGEHVWLESGDRLLICEALELELVVLLAVRSSTPTITPSSVAPPVMQLLSSERASGLLRICLPDVPWQRLARNTRVKLVARAVDHAQVQREWARPEARGSHGKSSSSRAEEELVHTNGPVSISSGQRDDRGIAEPCASPSSLRGVVAAQTSPHQQPGGASVVDDDDEDVEADCGAATPSRHNSQVLAVQPPTTGAEVPHPRARSHSPRQKQRRVESTTSGTALASSSTPVPHGSRDRETLDALQLRSRSSQVAASGGTDLVAQALPDSYQSVDSATGGSGADSGSTVLAKNSYMETFDEHLNEALLQLENRSAEMNTTWLQNTTALLGVVGGGDGGELLGAVAQRGASASDSRDSVSPARATRRRTSPRKSKSKSKTPRAASRRARRTRDSAETAAPSDVQDLPLPGAAESQEVFFQH